MLQIISGKFFKDGKINANDVFDVLYSSMSWIGRIDTDTVKMFPIAFGPNQINGYVLSYTNKYQPRDEIDVLHMPMSETITFQFKLLATLWFQAFFHQDKSVVEKYCSSVGGVLHENNSPKQFIENYFDLRMVSVDEVDGFILFFKQVMLMNRKSYNLLMRCLGGFYDSLEQFLNNYDLAYSHLVYVLETLLVDGQGYDPKWEDYDGNVQAELDEVLSNVPEDTANAVRAALLRGQNFKLKQRFVNGFIRLLGDEYFAPNKERKVVRVPSLEIRQTVENLYSTRSAYVHKLGTVDKGSKIPDISRARDFYYRKKHPYFTISGLVRTTRQILLNYVAVTEKLAEENWNWRAELPGIITMQLAPEYWVSKTQGVTTEHAIPKFNGFVEKLASDRQLIHIRDLLEIYGKNLGSTTPKLFPVIYSLFALYSLKVKDDDRPTDAKKILEKHSAKIGECHICYLVTMLYLEHTFSWSAQEMLDTFSKYRKSKYRENQVNLPVLIEIGLLSLIANSFLSEGATDSYESVTSEILPSCVNNADLFEIISTAKIAKTAIDIEKIMNLTSRST